MITNFSYVDELSLSQAETISGGFRAKWGDAEYEVNPTDKVEGDWTVTWVRTKPKGDRDIFNYSATGV
ncbi:hypothetical protein FACHB389_01350 [Nostoc calcicola FACHB-389]|nr:hypothetical protein [Nostoc calcicola FACHB-3891]OKH42331.1 hypothetical protein FACHB389_01350 [Nostoc calcicola FACHB-389]